MLLGTAISSAQRIKYSPVTKIKDSFHQHYIGSDSKKGQYVLLSNGSMKKDYFQSGYTRTILKFGTQKIKLVAYDSRYNFKAEYPIEFSNTLGVMYDGFIVDDEILIFYTSEDDFLMFVDKFKLNGEYISTTELDKRDEKKAVSLDPTLRKAFSFFTSEDKGTLCLKTNTTIKFYNNKLEELWGMKFGYSGLAAMKILDNGLALALCVADGSLYFVKYNITGKHDENVPVSYSAAIDDFEIAYDSGMAIMACQYSTSKDSDGRTFYATGLQINVFDVEEMEEKYSYKVKYNDEVLLGIGPWKKLEKVKGLAQLKISSVHPSAGNDVIVVLRRHTIVETTTTYSNSSATRKSYDDIYEGIVIVKSNDKGEQKQLLIPAESKGSSQYGPLLSLISLYKYGKLYLYYNEGRSSYKLTQTHISSDLDIIKSTAANTWKTYGIYYGIRDYQKINENKFIVLGRYQKKIGAMWINFKAPTPPR